MPIDVIDIPDNIVIQPRTTQESSEESDNGDKDDQRDR